MNAQLYTNGKRWGGPVKTRHNWTEDDDIALLVAIDEVGPLKDHYERQGYRTAAPWWNAVAGRLHTLREGAVRVTGSACRARFARLEEGYPHAHPSEVVARSAGAWDRVAEMVAKAEQAAVIHVRRTLTDLRRINADDLGDAGLDALLLAGLDRVGPEVG